MTNEAIRILKLAIEDSKEHIRFCFDSRGIEALNMAIKALEQQPCEDCISRKELINELKLGYFNNDLQEGKNDPCVIDAMIDWAIRTIKRQPSVTPSYNSIKTELKPCVTPKARWIPVSERLPEEGGTYMTTVDYGKHGFATGQRYYHGKGLGWEDDCVIAWMPLPEPYKAESEG